LRLHIAILHGASRLDQPISKGGFTVVDMGHDGKISDMGKLCHDGDMLTFGIWVKVVFFGCGETWKSPDVKVAILPAISLCNKGKLHPLQERRYDGKFCNQISKTPTPTSNRQSSAKRHKTRFENCSVAKMLVRSVSSSFKTGQNK